MHFKTLCVCVSKSNLLIFSEFCFYLVYLNDSYKSYDT